MLRGATLAHNFGNISMFQTDFGVPLQLYRGFKTPMGPYITGAEREFMASGGVLWYSFQPQDWKAMTSKVKINKKLGIACVPDCPDGRTDTKACSYNKPISCAGTETWHKKKTEWLWSDDIIDSYAKAVASAKPSKVFVAPGYEPNGHATEIQKKASAAFGSAAEYRAMWTYVRARFRAKGADNAVFVIDFASEIRLDENRFIASELFVTGHVDWLFWNMFQKATYAKDDAAGVLGGDCGAMFDTSYSEFSKNPDFMAVPWGIGAWMTRSEGYGAANSVYKATPIPDADRKRCLTDVAAALGDTSKYSQMKAMIYFNSQYGIVSPRTLVFEPCARGRSGPWGTAQCRLKRGKEVCACNNRDQGGGAMPSNPQLVPEFTSLMTIKPFMAGDVAWAQACADANITSCPAHSGTPAPVRASAGTGLVCDAWAAGECQGSKLGAKDGLSRAQCGAWCTAQPGVGCCRSEDGRADKTPPYSCYAHAGTSFESAASGADPDLSCSAHTSGPADQVPSSS